MCVKEVLRGTDSIHRRRKLDTQFRSSSYAGAEGGSTTSHLVSKISGPQLLRFRHPRRKRNTRKAEHSRNIHLFNSLHLATYLL